MIEDGKRMKDLENRLALIESVVEDSTPLIPETVDHGAKRKHYLYGTWRSMISRCHMVNDPNYKTYGRRGIKVCFRWRSSFPDFFEDVGDKPSNQHSLDRLFNYGPYAPWNVEWATAEQQADNKGTTRFLTIDHETKTVSQWVDEARLNWRNLESDNIWFNEHRIKDLVISQMKRSPCDVPSERAIEDVEM